MIFVQIVQAGRWKIDLGDEYKLRTQIRHIHMSRRVLEDGGMVSWSQLSRFVCPGH